MRTVIKTIITTVLLPTVLATAGNVEARLKYYRYNDSIPMVEMSLNMMVAMGVLEPIPSRLVHDGNPYHRMVNASYSPYSRSGYSYPGSSRRYNNHRYYDYLDGPVSPYDDYDRYSDDRYYRNRYGSSYDYPRYRSRESRWDSPWADRWANNQWGNQWDGPWGSTRGSPWDYQRGNSWNSPWDGPWGNNSWGNNSWGNQWGSPWNSGWGSPWGNQLGSPWSSGWGSPWGNQLGSPWSSGWGSPWSSGGNQWGSPWSSSYGGSPWGSPWGSSWSNQWMNPWSSQLGSPGAWPYSSGYSSLPLSPGAIPGDDWSKNRSYPSGDTSRQHLNKDDYNANKKGYNAEKTSWSGYPSRTSYRRSGYRSNQDSGSKRFYRKLNGLWIGENGEMLGIRGNQFLWHDDNNQYAKGQLVRSPTMMKARIEGSKTVVRYHYKLRGSELVIMGRDGTLRTFNRMPLQLPNATARPHAATSGYKPETDYVHVSYSNYRAGLKTDNTGLYSRKQSYRAGPAADSSRRSRSAVPHKYYSDKRFGMRGAHLPAATSKYGVNKSWANKSGADKYGVDKSWANKSGENTPSASFPAGSDRRLYNSKAATENSGYHGGNQQQHTPSKSVDTRSAVPTTTIPMFQQYLPAAGKPKSGHIADSDALPAEVMEVKSSIWNSSTAGLDMSDPNTYLYSYMKDNANTPGSRSSQSTENSGQADSVFTSKDKSQPSANNAGTNIWKPNNMFPDQRKNTTRAQSEITANSDIRKFSWPTSGSWD